MRREELLVKLKSIEPVIMKSCEDIYSDMLLASLNTESACRVYVKIGYFIKYFTCIIKSGLGYNKILFKNLKSSLPRLRTERCTVVRKK